MMACNTAQCCFCKGYIVNQSRHRMIIDKVDIDGVVCKNVDLYPNICDDCMAEVRETISDLDMSKQTKEGEDSAKKKAVFPSRKCAFCKNADLHYSCCNCRCLLCEDHAHQTEMDAQYKCPTCEWTNRVPYVHLTTATPTVSEVKRKSFLQ